MTGKIVKGIAGFYYVAVAGSGIYECKAKGIFRLEGVKPLPGDDVRIEVLDEAEKEANLVEILPRRSVLIRPAVANADQAMILFSPRQPEPNLAMLDRFLIMMEKQDVPVFLCINKTDLASEEEVSRLADIYTGCGYEVIRICAGRGEGIDALRDKVRGKTTVAAGPSGVGKSTLTNLLQSEVRMETGEISRKLRRGKNTTRHSQLFLLDEDTAFFDTPGFTSLDTVDVEKEELRFLFPEIRKWEGHCRFAGCVHINEPDCRVKEELAAGNIAPSRYESYRLFYEELKERERRRY